MKVNKHWTLLFFLMITSCNIDSFKHGERSYIQHCASCHMDDGSGLKELIPDLYFEPQEIGILDKTPCFIRYGINDSSTVVEMVANKEISDIDITNIINYIANDLNSLDTIYSLEHISYALTECSN